MRRYILVAALLVLARPSCETVAAELRGLKEGAPEIRSASSLAFGPEDILFIGDAVGAAVFAVATGDTQGDPAAAAVNIGSLGDSLKGLLRASQVAVNDLAVNPATGNAFLAVTADESPAVVKVDGGGKLEVLSLSRIHFAKADLSDPPEDKVVGEGRRARNPRQDSITDIAWFGGKLLVSGLSSGKSPSTIRELNFPFAESDKGVSVEIYHAAHGKDEDFAAMRTFVPVMIDGEPSVVGAYTCTPLVRIPVKQLSAAGKRVRGTTVAELGNRNRPLDLIAYRKGGAEFLLLSNSARGVMKISTQGLQQNKGLAEPVRDGATAGQTYETIEAFRGVVQMDRLNETSALLLLQDDAGVLALQTVELP